MSDETTSQETTGTSSGPPTQKEDDKSLLSEMSDKDDDKSLITEGDGKDKEALPVEPLKVEDLVLPEGFEVNDEAQTSFVEILNDKDLSPAELANKLVSLQATMAQAASDSISDAWNTMQDEWKAAAQSHPEFGGSKLAPTLGSIKELIGEVMGDQASEVFDAMDLTGMGSHPGLISLLAKLAGERAEGRLVIGSPTAPTPSAAEVMFPDQGKT